MKFFEAVPSELFSPLASPNRILYADALDVLYAAYQENLKIREDVLYSMLRGRLEQELADATFEDEDIDEEELRDISGRARFLIRKLCSNCLLYTSRAVFLLLFGQGLPLEIDFIFGDVHSLAGLLFRGIIIQPVSYTHL